MIDFDLVLLGVLLRDVLEVEVGVAEREEVALSLILAVALLV